MLSLVVVPMSPNKSSFRKVVGDGSGRKRVNVVRAEGACQGQASASQSVYARNTRVLFGESACVRWGDDDCAWVLWYSLEPLSVSLSIRRRCGVGAVGIVYFGELKK